MASHNLAFVVIQIKVSTSDTKYIAIGFLLLSSTGANENIEGLLWLVCWTNKGDIVLPELNMCKKLSTTAYTS